MYPGAGVSDAPSLRDGLPEDQLARFVLAAVEEMDQAGVRALEQGDLVAQSDDVASRPSDSSATTCFQASDSQR